MLIDEIKKANIQAMKDRDIIKKNVFSIVITKYNNLAIELRAKGQEIKDSDMLSIIQKTLKELEDERADYKKAGNQNKAVEIALQIKALVSYLPRQLSEKEIKEEINKLEDKSIPSVMKHFKANFAGKVDMSLVSKIAKELK